MSIMACSKIDGLSFHEIVVKRLFSLSFIGFIFQLKNNASLIMKYKNTQRYKEKINNLTLPHFYSINPQVINVNSLM